MKHKRRIALFLIVATILTWCVGCLAFFTDRATGDATATAGTLELALDGLEPTAPEKFRPSQGIALDYVLSNEGNKSADILETFVLTYTPADGVTSSLNSADPEFTIYPANAVRIDASTGVATILNASAALSSYVDGTHIKYEVPQYIMNGAAEKDGVETENGAVGDERTGAYVLVFEDHAGNDFQGANLTLEYEAQAKQHRNTNDATWTTVKSETITFGGDTAHKAVPKK